MGVGYGRLYLLKIRDVVCGRNGGLEKSRLVRCLHCWCTVRDGLVFGVSHNLNSACWLYRSSIKRTFLAPSLFRPLVKAQVLRRNSKSLSVWCGFIYNAPSVEVLTDQALIILKENPVIEMGIRCSIQRPRLSFFVGITGSRPEPSEASACDFESRIPVIVRILPVAGFSWKRKHSVSQLLV
jgi:hypothetical protein